MVEPHICELKNYPKKLLKKYQQNGRDACSRRDKNKNAIKNKMLRAMEVICRDGK